MESINNSLSYISPRVPKWLCMLSVIVAASNQRRIYTGLRTFQINKNFRHKILGYGRGLICFLLGGFFFCQGWHVSSLRKIAKFNIRMESINKKCFWSCIFRSYVFVLTKQRLIEKLTWPDSRKLLIFTWHIF